MSQQPLAIDAGAGPGLGRHFVDHLSHEGCNAFGLNRTLQDDHRIRATDLGDAGQVNQAIKDMLCAAGAPRLVIHKAARLVIAPFEAMGEAF